MVSELIVWSLCGLGWHRLVGYSHIVFDSKGHVQRSSKFDSFYCWRGCGELRMVRVW